MIGQMISATDESLTTENRMWRVVIARTIQDWLSKPLRPKREAEPAGPPEVNPQEEADYKALEAVKPTDYDQQITLGESFVYKWVDSKFRESVHAELMHAYFQKQDFAKMYENVSTS